MVVTLVRFCLIILLALLAGTMFGILVGYNPASLSAEAYIEQQQQAIRGLNTLLPAMGAIAIVLTIGLAIMLRSDQRTRMLLIVVAGLLIIAGVITRFANQPINAVVMTWNPQSPPANWMELRDTWWSWHIVRTIVAVGALALTALETLLFRRAVR